ncbi:CaiB/BaiF CoA transferase family protein [Nonomuraea aurantiaca]|uniref:CaiB/BaiF CoA transferase family protein n=1 Tax=Nonomuraea aurantiaca TaxID=2878562 RepID=UPI001CD9BA76|nr:CaiB/BaiF CoA-transferase family protein [Nonomuraea aurantiaca]MCA2230280.1 CoA transferase [Nonomuraea aurantiaca]
MTLSSGPLDGLVVVALEQAVAAPFASRQLADLGARTIKIERPGGGDFARGYDSTVHGLASHFVWLNAGKESVVADLKTAEGRALLDRLLAHADVFIQNLSPRAARSLGVSARQLTERHSRLIACDISGYGSGGPYEERKAYDLLIQSEAGLVAVTGTPETPAKVGISIADIAAGMYAYSGILSALHQRHRTGLGTALEVSMLEALGEWMGYAYLYSGYGGTQPARAGASHATIAPYGPVRTLGGQIVMFGLQNEREWAVFCGQVLRRADVAQDPRFGGNAQRVEHREELDRIVADVFAELELDEAVGRLESAGIAYAQQRSLAEFVAHPQLKARDRWRTAQTSAGPVEVLKPAVTADWPTPSGSVPALGEHTEGVLAWLDGLEAEQGVTA